MRTCIEAWMSSKFGQIRPLVSMATDIESYVVAIYSNHLAILIDSLNICFYGELMVISQKISKYLVYCNGLMGTEVFT